MKTFKKFNSFWKQLNMDERLILENLAKKELQKNILELKDIYYWYRLSKHELPEKLIIKRINHIKENDLQKYDKKTQQYKTALQKIDE